MFELPGRPAELSPRILFLVATDYEALEHKGVARMILERDEGGFFERVVTVHPLAMQDRIIDLTPVHRVYEFSAGRCLQPATIAGALGFPFRLCGTVRQVLRIARKERVNVIRATDAYLMGAIGWIIARLSNIPLCVSIHAPYDERFAMTPKTGMQGFRRMIAAVLPRFVLRRADLVLPIRDHLAASAIGEGAAPRRVRVIPHGVDFQAFDAAPAFDIRRELAIPDHTPIVSFAGRLAGDNRIDDVLEIARQLASRRSDYVLVIAGGGELAGRVNDWIARHPDAARLVRCVGFWPREKVIALRQASIAALALMGGFSLIEACAAACVPVAYDLEWHHELVSDETGFLVPPGDIDAAVQGIERLLDDPALALRMGCSARARAVERHDIRRTTAIKRQAYESVLARWNPRVRAS